MKLEDGTNPPPLPHPALQRSFPSGDTHFTIEADIEVNIADRLNEVRIRFEIYNAGCMYWSYAPVTLNEILAYRKTFRPNYWNNE